MSPHPIAAGDRVEVTAIDGLTLTVHGQQQTRPEP